MFYVPKFISIPFCYTDFVFVFKTGYTRRLPLHLRFIGGCIDAYGSREMAQAAARSGRGKNFVTSHDDLLHLNRDWIAFVSLLEVARMCKRIRFATVSLLPCD